MNIVFVKPETVLEVPGVGTVHAGNLTLEKYNALLRISDNFKTYFTEKKDGGNDKGGATPKSGGAGATK